MADLVEGIKPEFDLSSFNPGRFSSEKAGSVT
jgi:hypothetical protein